MAAAEAARDFAIGVAKASMPAVFAEMEEWRKRNETRGTANQVSHPKSSTNSSQRIPSPFMGEG